MSFHMLADLLGNTDHRAAPIHDSIYLLREDYRILSIRRSDHESIPVPQVGDDFFACYPADERELRTLESMKSYATRHSLLMRAGRRPVVILFAIFASTRLLVAIVPDAPLRRCLNAPAAYATLLQEFYLFLSPASANRQKPLDETGQRIIYPWVQRLYQALFCDRVHPLEQGAELLRAVLRLRYLSELCGCAVDYDLTGIAHVKKEQADLDRLISSVFALLLTVHAVSPERHVKLIAGTVYGSGPMAAAMFTCKQPIESLGALQHLAREARLRGERFEITRHPEDPDRVMVQFALCHKEISEQGIKHPLPDHFTEGKRFLPFEIPDPENS